MQVTSQIDMDLAVPGLIPMVEGVQGDSARVVKVRLTENGKAWEIPQGAQVLIRYRNQNGKGGVFDTLPDGKVAYSFTGNVLTLILPAQVWGTVGITKIQAVIAQGDKQVSVFAFQALCESAYAGEPGGEYTNLTAWLKAHGVIPVKGVDYWTEDDIAEIQTYIDTQLGVIEHGAY